MVPSIYIDGHPVKVFNEAALRRLAATNHAIRQARLRGDLPAVATIHIDCDPPRAELIAALPAFFLDHASGLLSQRQPDGQYRVYVEMFGIKWMWPSDRPVAHQSTSIVPITAYRTGGHDARRSIA